MPGPREVVFKLEDALAAAARCATEETSQNYDALAQELQDVAELTREFVELDADYGALVKKLRSGDALSAEDMTTLRLLVVGDADYYLKYDEEFARCKAEIGKIVAEIDRLRQSELGVDGLMHLSVLCREAGNLLPLAQHYLEARDRVRRFEAATRGTISRDDAQALAAIVEEMVAASRRI